MNVLLPGDLRQALDMLSGDGSGAIPIAGGTDLLVHWPQHSEAHARTYLDLSALSELRPVTWTDDELILGGLTTFWDIVQDPRAAVEFPLLREAGRQVGAVQIQARGTWAGNVVNASPAADGVPVLMAYDATLVLESSQGSETAALSDFYVGYKEMKRRPDQLITQIRLPRREHTFQRFFKVGSRRAQAIAKVGLAVVNSKAGWRVVAGSMAPTVCRCPSIEALLESGALIEAPEDLLSAVRSDVSPIDDIRSSAHYREHVMARLLFSEVFKSGQLPR
ncbi:MAG: FAD binding domain-containing protein [Gemmatimonadota bacterium]